MSALVLLNLLNKFRKSDKMQRRAEHFITFGRGHYGEISTN